MEGSPLGQILALSEEVRDALVGKRAVVALESTIVAHGMPYPANLETAFRVEAAVRVHGAVPATIAILDKKICVGLSREQLERVARAGRKALKCSRRDVAFAIAEGVIGATTVSATMMCAHLAGIRVFVTGGLGGVHRGAETSMDVSADLTELGRTPMAVVSSGVKSILDIPRTLEYLETQGVPVLCLGTDRFPAFYLRDSGCPAHLVANDEAHAARVVHAQFALGLQTGVVVAVPIPQAEEADAKVIQDAIAAALQESSSKGIVGKEITPFLLQRISELTGGASLASNISLVLNNAATGARIAVALAQL